MNNPRQTTVRRDMKSGTLQHFTIFKITFVDKIDIYSLQNHNDDCYDQEVNIDENEKSYWNTRSVLCQKSKIWLASLKCYRSQYGVFVPRYQHIANQFRNLLKCVSYEFLIHFIT